MRAASNPTIGPRTRLLMLTGPGGSGTTTMWAATVAALQAEGLRPSAVRAAPDPHPRAVALMADTVGRILGDMGADRAPSLSWSGLPGLRTLSTLMRTVDALADPAVDVVVVDCGPLDRAIELVSLPSTLVRLLDSALTPRLAMWRAPGDGDDGPTVFEALSQARAEAERLEGALQHPATTVRLVTAADAVAVDDALDAVSYLSLLGVRVESVVVTRRGGSVERSSPDELAEEERQWARVRALRPGVQSWKSRSADRPAPKGRAVVDALGSLPALEVGDPVASGPGEEFSLDIALVGPRAHVARIGRLGDDLVVEIDDVRRWVRLPSVLQRCHAQHAERTPLGLRLSFRPDESAWRRPPEATP